jgi:signal peptidase I
MRKLVTAIACTVLIITAAAVLTGGLALVWTHGNSMYPRITTGDLVIVAKQSTYRPGEVVAYRSTDLREIVLHRVKAIHGNRYTFRGDHNDFDDPEHPEVGHLIGREVIHIPSGGIWLDRLIAPQTLALIAFVLAAGGGTAANQRRNRRKRPMAQPTRSATNLQWRSAISLTRRVVILSVAFLSVAGVVLACFAWTRPATLQRSPVASEATLTFSYGARVPVSAAYQGTTVTAPDPLFRSLVHIAEVRYAYTGRPGTARVDAELSSANGWHARIPLQATTRFERASFRGRVLLDLDAVSRRAAAAAAVIGMPLDQVEVAVVPTIVSADGQRFVPRLTFILTPTQLRLASDEPQLEFRDTARSISGAATANTVGIAGRRVTWSALRVIPACAGVVALGLLVLALFARRRRTATEAATIMRRYRSLLLEVEPITSPAGRPIVEVTDFVALAKLAERCGVLVLHWTRSHVHTFVVHDDGVTYRHRVDDTARRSSSLQPTSRTGSPTDHESPRALGEPASQV